MPHDDLPSCSQLKKMDHKPFFEILDQERLIPADELSQWLGRIVKHHREPEASYTPTDPSPFVIYPLSVTEIDNVFGNFSSLKSNSVSLALSNTVSLSNSGSTGGTTGFDSKRIVSVRLQRHDKIFRSLRENNEVQEDLREMLTPGGGPAFMIVGVLLWSDATFTSTRSLTSVASTNVSSPLAAAFKIATGTSMPAIVDVSISPSKDTSTSKTLQGVSLGSHIFAIQYKMVRRPSFALGRSFTPRLEDKGPRVEGSKKFGDNKDANLKVEGGEVEEPLEVNMDEDFVEWTDVLDEEEEGIELETEEFEGIGLAYSVSL